MLPTSASLLDRLHGDGDPASWRRLADPYSPLILTWVRGNSNPPDDADDLVQEVLEVLLRRLPDFEHNGRAGAFRAWLRGITTNVLREFWRERPAPGSDSLLEELADPHAELSRLWDEQHDRHVLHGLMEVVRPEFTPATWQAFCRAAL